MPRLPENVLPLVERGPNRGQIDMAKAAALNAVAGKLTLYYHPTLAGLSLNVSTTGKRGWFFQARVGGKSRRVQLMEFGAPDAEVMAKAKDWAQEFREGRDPLVAQQLAAAEVAAMREGVLTTQGLFEEYLRIRGTKLRPSSIALYEKLMKNYAAGLAAKKITELRPIEFAELYQKLVREKSAATANVTLDMLRAVFRWAVDFEVIEKSPVEAMQRQKIRVASGVRSRVVKASDLPDWWKAVTHFPDEFPYSVMIRMALLTGVRRGELAGMVWSEVEGNVWKLPGARTKNGKGREIPFTRHVGELMDRARAVSDLANARSRRLANDGHVFFTGWDNELRPAKNPVRNFQLPLAKVADRGGVLTSWHDLRRSWSSFAAMTPGVPEIVRRKVLGHGMVGVTEAHYTVIGIEDIRAGMQLVEERILGLAGVAVQADAQVPTASLAGR